MELKLDKTTKILLGAIALGLFLNVSNVFIDKAQANDFTFDDEYDLRKINKDYGNECATRLFLTQQLERIAVTLGTKMDKESDEVQNVIQRAQLSIETTLKVHAPRIK